MQRSNTVHQEDHQQLSPTQEIPLEPGPEIFGHIVERSDLYRILSIDKGPKISFSASEYLLTLLFLEHEGSEVSYATIASEIYGYNLDEDLLTSLRKRVSAIRRKIADYGIDIVNIPHHGYMVRDLTDLAIPYRRGYRARVRRKR